MENDTRNQVESQALFAEAKKKIIEDMATREIGAIIWDNSTAGFHQIPEIEHISTRTGKERVARITGLYAYKDTLYLIEEDRAGVSVDNFYNHNTEVKPTVVTLTEDMAVKSLGDPDEERGYTRQGTLEEWLVITDCYFEALTEI